MTDLYLHKKPGAFVLQCIAFALHDKAGVVLQQRIRLPTYKSHQDLTRTSGSFRVINYSVKDEQVA